MKLRRRLVVAAGAAALVTAAGATVLAVDTTGSVGNGAFDSGDLAAWSNTGYTGKLADWSANEDSQWNNNYYFNAGTDSMDDETDSIANGENRAMRVWKNNFSGTNLCLDAYGLSGYAVGNTGTYGLHDNISSHTKLSFSVC